MAEPDDFSGLLWGVVRPGVCDGEAGEECLSPPADPSMTAAGGDGCPPSIIEYETVPVLSLRWKDEKGSPEKMIQQHITVVRAAPQTEACTIRRRWRSFALPLYSSSRVRAASGDTVASRRALSKYSSSMGGCWLMEIILSKKVPVYLRLSLLCRLPCGCRVWRPADVPDH